MRTELKDIILNEAPKDSRLYTKLLRKAQNNLAYYFGEPAQWSIDVKVYAKCSTLIDYLCMLNNHWPPMSPWLNAHADTTDLLYGAFSVLLWAVKRDTKYVSDMYGVMYLALCNGYRLCLCGPSTNMYKAVEDAETIQDAVNNLRNSIAIYDIITNPEAAECAVDEARDNLCSRHLVQIPNGDWYRNILDVIYSEYEDMFDGEMFLSAQVKAEFKDVHNAWRYVRNIYSTYYMSDRFMYANLFHDKVNAIRVYVAVALRVRHINKTQAVDIFCGACYLALYNGYRIRINKEKLPKETSGSTSRDLTSYLCAMEEAITFDDLLKENPFAEDASKLPKELLKFLFEGKSKEETIFELCKLADSAPRQIRADSTLSAILNAWQYRQ